MKIGSHNSMSYLPPKYWVAYPFRWLARCQSATLKDQYEKYGVEVFDLRISYNRKGEAQFKHGFMVFKGDVETMLIYLNNIKASVRLILEDRRYERDNALMFKHDCEEWVKKYPNIKFYGGNRKYDWRKLYDFPSIEDDTLHLYASMQGGKMDDLFPKEYAKKNNHENIEKNKDFHGIIMLDYVNLQ